MLSCDFLSVWFFPNPFSFGYLEHDWLLIGPMLQLQIADGLRPSQVKFRI